MSTWRLIAHHFDAEHALRWFCADSLIAVGWGRVGDLRQHGPTGPDVITRLVRDAYPELENDRHGGPSLWRFYREAQTGDLVIVSDGTTRRLVMRVEGEYQYAETPSPVPPGDYQHQRRAIRVSADPDMLWLRCGGKVSAGENIRWTFVRCADGEQNA